MVYIQTIIDPTSILCLMTIHENSRNSTIIKERRKTIMGMNGVTTTKYAKYILTAGHCVVLGDNHVSSPSDVSLFFGTTDVSLASYQLSELHLRCSEHSCSSSVQWRDVALLELKNEIRLDDNSTRPIPLNTETYFAPGTRTLAAGWEQKPKSQQNWINSNLSG